MRSPLQTRRHNRGKAFTLVELIVSVLIITVLAAISSVAYNQFVGKSSQAKAQASAAALRDALQARATTEDVSVAELAAGLWAGTDPLKGLSTEFDGTVEYQHADGTDPATLRVTAVSEKHSACIDLPESARVVPPVYNCTPGTESGNLTTPPGDDDDGEFNAPAPDPEPEPEPDPEPEQAACDAVGTVTTDDGKWQVSCLPDDTVSLLGFATGHSVTILNIPAKVTVGTESYRVTTIGSAAFRDNGLTSVTIPNTITAIDLQSFYKNQLTSVTIPESVTSIGDVAFYYNQLRSVAIPDSVTSIGINAFASNQLTSVTIGNSVTTIGYLAFASNQLTSVTIGNSVAFIDSHAFWGNHLTSVTIPGSVTSIGTDAFNNQPAGGNRWHTAPNGGGSAWNYTTTGVTTTYYWRS